MLLTIIEIGLTETSRVAKHMWVAYRKDRESFAKGVREGTIPHETSKWEMWKRSKDVENSDGMNESEE